MLDLRAVNAGYGNSQVLFGLSLNLGEGELGTLIGRNGMGKTTTVRGLMGLLPVTGGRVVFAGQDITGWPSHRIARAGIGLVPEGRQIFPNLSLRENLVATARRNGPGHWTLDRVFALFPRLRERQANRGDQLSGGEQQMLAIARALMTNPSLLILDEATEGLAPLIRHEIWSVLAELKRAGLAILVIDKHIEALSAIADRHTIIEKGRDVWSGDSDAFLADPALRDRYLGV